jgi:hypothetical protein
LILIIISSHFFKKIIFIKKNTSDRQNDQHCDKLESPPCYHTHNLPYSAAENHRPWCQVDGAGGEAAQPQPH